MEEGDRSGTGHWLRGPDADGDLPAVALVELVARIRDGCEGGSEWPQKVGAGLYAGVGFLTEEREMARALFDDPSASRFGKPFRDIVHTMSQLLDEVVPVEARPGPRAPAAAIAGVGLVVGDCVRLGRLRRLTALCPDLHLMVLLPFLGFDEARDWAEAFQEGAIR